MTREEQIIKAARDYINSDVASPMNMHLAFGDFINGAKWADEHPILTEEEEVGMGGLGMEWQKQALIKKACEWWSEWFDTHNPYNMGDCINDFKNAMK